MYCDCFTFLVLTESLLFENRPRTSGTESLSFLHTFELSHTPNEILQNTGKYTWFQESMSLPNREGDDQAIPSVFCVGSAPLHPLYGKGCPSVPPSELLNLTQQHRGRSADLIAARGQDMIWLDIPVLPSSKVYLRKHGEDSPVSALQRGQLVAFVIHF